jgi:hypothetical protein
MLIFRKDLCKHRYESEEDGFRQYWSTMFNVIECDQIYSSCSRSLHNISAFDKNHQLARSCHQILQDLFQDEDYSTFSMLF